MCIVVMTTFMYYIDRLANYSRTIFTNTLCKIESSRQAYVVPHRTQQIKITGCKYCWLKNEDSILGDILTMQNECV